MTIEAVQQDVSVRPTGTLIGDQERLRRKAEKLRAELPLFSVRNGRANVEAALADAEMELDFVRAELRARP